MVAEFDAPKLPPLPTREEIIEDITPAGPSDVFFLHFGKDLTASDKKNAGKKSDEPPSSKASFQAQLVNSVASVNPGKSPKDPNSAEPTLISGIKALGGISSCSVLAEDKDWLESCLEPLKTLKSAVDQRLADLVAKQKHD